MKDKLKNIGDIANFINSSSRLDEILELITFGLCKHSIWSMSGVLAVDAAAGVTRMVARYDPYTAEYTSAPTEWALDVSPSLKVVASGQPLIIHNVPEQTDYPTYRSDAILRSYRTAVILPLKMSDSEGRPLVLTAHARTDVDVSEDELIFLLTVAGLAGIAIARTGQIETENNARTRLEQIVRIHSNLMQKALSDGDLTTIFNDLAQLFSFPSFVYETMTDSMIVGGHVYPSEVGQDEWVKWVEKAAPEPVSDFVRLESVPQDPFVLSLANPPFSESVTQGALALALEVDGEVAGALVLFSEQDALDEIDLVLIQMAKLVLGVVLMRARLKVASEIDTRASIYEQLFAQDWRNADLLKARAMRIGVDLNEPARLLLIRRKTQTDAQDNRGRSDNLLHDHQVIDRIAEAHFERWGTLHIDGNFLLVLPGDGEADGKWRKQQSDFLGTLSWSLNEEPILVVSRLCKMLEDYSREWKHCVRTAQLAQTFQLSGYVSDRDLGSSSLLLSITDNVIVQDYLANHILPIVQHDAEHNTDYLQSLKAFVELEGGYKACAARLGIHVTTLRYRIERINEIFDIDATDQSARFDLQLAIRLLNLA